MLKAAIFDMDGVIVDSEPLHRQAYYNMFNEVSVDISDTLYDTFKGRSTINICRQLVEEFGVPKTAEELVRIKRHHYDIIFEKDKTFDLIEGVRSLIEGYYNNGLTLVLASSSSMASIDRIFNRFDLNPFFKGKISGAELKASKPHPEIFIKAAENTGFDRNECLVIEDTTNGINAAKAAGIFCVGFNDDNKNDEDYTDADLEISDFKEIHYEKITKVFTESTLSL